MLFLDPALGKMGRVPSDSSLPASVRPPVAVQNKFANQNDSDEKTTDMISHSTSSVGSVKMLTLGDQTTLKNSKIRRGRLESQHSESQIKMTGQNAFLTGSSSEDEAKSNIT